jgi:hypothetical protein
MTGPWPRPSVCASPLWAPATVIRPWTAGSEEQRGGGCEACIHAHVCFSLFVSMDEREPLPTHERAQITASCLTARPARCLGCLCVARVPRQQSCRPARCARTTTRPGPPPNPSRPTGQGRRRPGGCCRPGRHACG